MDTKTETPSVRLIDTTLRDGEQAPGVVFTLSEKLDLVRLLDEAGVDEMEVGIPAMGAESCREIQAMVRLRPRCLVTSWCRAVKADIDQASDCGTDGVHISFPVSPILLQAMGKSETWVMVMLEKLVSLALERFSLVSVGAQDSFRAAPDFLRSFVQGAAASGAHRVRIADTVGLARPSQVHRLVLELTGDAGTMDLEFHGHNDLGMATANTVTAIEAGIQAASVTVNGIGERAGNAALEQVAVALSTMENRSSAIDIQQLMTICGFVSDVTHRPIPADRPITGNVAFCHESGIHCAALIKNDDAYQPFSPEIVGRTSARLVIGRHSGSGVIKHVMKNAGVVLDARKTEKLLDAVRSEALQRKSYLSTVELINLYHNVAT